MEVGRIREAAEIFDSFEGQSGDYSMIKWRDLAATSSMLFANYARAEKLWNDQSHIAVEAQMPPTMLTLPFLTLNPQWVPDMYPVLNVSSTAQMVQAVRIEGTQMRFQVACAQVEAGANDNATKSIRQAIELNPISQARPLMRFYLECLTGEQIELKVETPATEEFDDLADDEGDSETKPIDQPEGNPDKKSDPNPNPKPE